MLYAPKSGGVKRYLTAKRAWLARRRRDVTHTLVVPGAATRARAEGLVTVAAPKLPFTDGYRCPTRPVKWGQVLRALQPDLIEAGDPYVPGHAALDAAEMLGVPAVAFTHTDAVALAQLHLGDWAAHPALRAWSTFCKRFDKVVAPSAFIRERLVDYGVDQVEVQHLGVDLELFHPMRADRAALRRRLGLGPEARLLMFAGRPSREKNLEALVGAVQRLGAPYHLLLIGAGRDLCDEDRVICLGYERDPVRLAGVMASCDALVHANANEPFGLVVLEALASGLPVVGPRKGGVGELIDATVGQPAHRADGVGMAEAIEALFARDRQAVARAARARAVDRHGWDATFEGLMRIYGDLLARGARAPIALSA
ncbi:MAG: glycosyltransferase [Caulobacteraceae bacterium]|nr:glycosyltransferase [Caulobacteraceae bacterium]